SPNRWLLPTPAGPFTNTKRARSDDLASSSSRSSIESSASRPDDAASSVALPLPSVNTSLDIECSPHRAPLRVRFVTPFSNPCATFGRGQRSDQSRLNERLHATPHQRSPRPFNARHQRLSLVEI